MKSQLECVVSILVSRFQENLLGLVAGTIQSLATVTSPAGMGIDFGRDQERSPQNGHYKKTRIGCLRSVYECSRNDRYL